MLHWETLTRRITTDTTVGEKKNHGVYMDLHTRDGTDGSAAWIDNATVMLHTVSGSARAKADKLRTTGNWFVVSNRSQAGGQAACVRSVQ